VLGNLATSVVAGVASFTFFWIADIKYPLALAMLVAIFDLIPLVGATIAAVVCSAVAFFVSIGTGLFSVAFFLVYQQVENFVVVPKVMKRTVDISPLATIVAALIGGTLLGIIGALLAIPVAAAIQISIIEYGNLRRPENIAAVQAPPPGEDEPPPDASDAPGGPEPAPA